MALLHDHGLYFDLAPDAQIVEIERLHPTKPPAQQPASVARALDRMAEASAGGIPRRPPLLVRRREDGDFDIIDGNATYGAARKLGWPDLPVVVESGGGANHL
jgi:hypothetical protein